MKIKLLCGLSLLGSGVVVNGAAFVIDDGGAGFSDTGGWTNQLLGGRYDGDWQYQNTANGTETATYSFTGLPNGRYVASTSSWAQGNLSTDAVWTLSNGAGTFNVNQQVQVTNFDGESGMGSGVSYMRFGGSMTTAFEVTDGTFSGVLSDNDATGFLIADALRVEQVRPDVQAIHVIGNGDAGYAETGGSWLTWAGDPSDHGLDMRYSDANTAAQVMVSFVGLAAGDYRISTTWTAGGNRPTNVTLGYSTTGASGSTSFNQVPGAAADDVFEESNWQDMFSSVTVTDGTLTLTLDNTSGDGLMIADGFRLELIPEPSTSILMALAGLGLIGRRRRG